MSDESNRLAKAREAIVRRDPDSAFKIWTELASEGNAIAQHSLGWCYEQGVGCDTNYFECARLWNLAAAKGVPESMYGMGYCYEHGRGIEKNITAAYCWYVVAMRSGYDGANRDVERLRFLLKPAEFQEAKAFLNTLARS